MINPMFVFRQVSVTAVEVTVEMLLVGLVGAFSSARKKQILIRNWGSFLFNWKGSGMQILIVLKTLNVFVSENLALAA